MQTHSKPPNARPPTPHPVADLRDVMLNSTCAERFLISRMPADTELNNELLNSTSSSQRGQYAAMSDSNPWPLLDEAFHPTHGAASDTRETVRQKDQRRAKPWCRLPFDFGSIRKDSKIESLRAQSSSDTKDASSEEATTSRPTNPSPEHTTGISNLERYCRAKKAGKLSILNVPQDVLKGCKYYKPLKGDITHQSASGSRRSQDIGGNEQAFKSSSVRWLRAVRKLAQHMPFSKSPSPSREPMIHDFTSTHDLTQFEQMEADRDRMASYQANRRGGVHAAYGQQKSEVGGVRTTTLRRQRSVRIRRKPISSCKRRDAKALREVCQAATGSRTKQPRRKKTYRFFNLPRWWDLGSMTPIAEQQEQEQEQEHTQEGVLDLENPATQELRDLRELATGEKVVARRVGEPDESDECSITPAMHSRTRSKRAGRLRYTRQHGIPDHVVVRGGSLCARSARSRATTVDDFAEIGTEEPALNVQEHQYILDLVN